MQNKISAHFHTSHHSRKCISNVLRLQRDWTNEELDELASLENQPSGRYFFECSQSDEGDPWCVMFLPGQHEIILLHIAKIDCRYVVVSPGDGRLLRTKSIADVIGFGLSVLDKMPRQITNSPQLR